MTTDTTPQTSPHMTQVRTVLLATLANLCDRENPMDIERAKAVAQVAGVLVDTAKVENEYLKITGADRSDFLEQAPQIGGPSAHNPFPGVRVHRLQG